MTDMADDARVMAARISILTTLGIPLWPQHRAGHMELCGDCRTGGEPCHLVLAMDRCVTLVVEVRELRAILSELVSSLKAVGFGHMPKEAYEAPNPSGAQLVEAALARAAEAP